MIVVDSRDQALSLLTAAINHSDLAVKLSSLKQARDILSSLDSSSTADLFPYVADLQRSPHTLVRKFLLEIIEDIALRTIEHSAVLVPVLVAFLRDVDSDVVKQSIVTGTHFFCSVLEEMTLQFQQYGKVDQWVQELWMWMIRFKEGVFSIALQPGPVGIKLLALKFLETYILLFTPDNVYYEKFEATRGSRRTFNISWLSGSHPILDPIALTSDANRNLFVLLEMLQSASSLPGAVTINIVNCLAAIARKRPQHYATVLSALLDFNPNFETVREFHKASIQYSLRTSFLGFLRCTYPGIVESRERLLRALQAMNAGDASDQVIRQVEKMIKNSERERVSREIQSVRDVKASSQAYILGDVSKKRSMPQDNEELTNSFEIASKRIRSGPNSHSTPPTQISDSGQDFSSVNGASPSFPLLDDNLTPVEQMIAMIGALLAEGERAAESLEILISKIHPDLLAEIVITNMRHLPKSPPLSKVGTLPTTQQAVNINSRVQVFPPVPTNPLHTPLSTPQLPVTSAATTGSSISDTSTVNNFAADSKRDPRRIDADDDIIVMLGKQIVVDYQQQKGHEIVLQVLYHLYSHTVTNSVDNSSYAAVLYEKFLLEVSKSLLDTLPASDKSFSRLLGEVPFLPDSALKLLDDLCFSDVFDITGKEIRDAERVTQGLGVVWSLILGRPNNRQACLGIVLKCAVHSQDDIRGKAIRLVANKLYQLNYISGEIEKFATNMMLSAVGQRAAGAEFMQSVSIDERVEREVGSGDTSTSGSQLSEPRASGIDPENTESASSSSSVVSLPEAQRFLSLFFALCTKKPSLLQLLFDIYGRAPKVVKQAFHRHIPIVIRALGQSYSQLLRIISDPPQGSENLLTLVLQVLTQEATPSPDLVATVKHLYETKLKDATILIPMLSSLSKNEVLPIFPRLVDLPLEKFQLALAHILQGSAHTGPALTPAEVLVAIHDILPEKGGPPLKKITDACSACFEQRTVFTQQVLAKALNQLVDQVPLPLLFMRTVIQAIDAFPTLVDFVMEILSKLVSKQIWRMPKLWVGFLKCVVQTQPHSFPVLLQLPPPQLESTLNKFGSLRSSLASYASQPNIKGSLPRSTLAILGLANEQHMQPQQQPHMSNLHSSDASSVQGATTT
ncbi:symplekin-like isoform X3 [Hibiscus syriacus]|uniref:symplekin-like isoform X3 n=1 Tax=Hibiscus syriacus TaxID=106335 RepID=UPI0019234AD8|nr:symplekin-like isoform X3 [Hibiscus syriacus]